MHSTIVFSTCTNVRHLGNRHATPCYVCYVNAIVIMVFALFDIASFCPLKIRRTWISLSGFCVIPSPRLSLLVSDFLPFYGDFLARVCINMSWFPFLLLLCLKCYKLLSICMPWLARFAFAFGTFDGASCWPL